MKIKYFIVQNILVVNCFSMDLIDKPAITFNSKKLPNLIKVAIQTNNKKDDLQDMLNQFQKEQAKVTREKKEKSTLNEALNAANENLKSAKGQLRWWGNVGRIKLAAGGFTSILYGLTKGGYDLFLFSEDDTNITKNIFDVVSDGTLIAGGYFALKLAWQNGGAQSEYQKAQMIKFMVETTANNLENTNNSSTLKADELTEFEEEEL